MMCSFRQFIGWVGVAALVGACSPKSSAPADVRPGRSPDAILEDFRMTETSTGTRSWTMHARSASVFNTENTIEVQGVDVDFYEASGQPYSHLRSDRGLINQTSNDMRAQGHVDIRTQQGVHVEAEILRYWNTAERITSDQFVRVTDAKGSTISGVGFESDIKVEHYKVGKVNATIRGGKVDL